MKKSAKYDASGLVEAQFEPGSAKRVLKNLLAIKHKREMDKYEAVMYVKALKKFAGIYDKDHRFTAQDICDMHNIWLRGIYPWAGKYRQVMLSKDGFPFAAPKHIPALMEEFENKVLRKYTPCRFKTHEDTAEAVAVVHTELVLIHPFREGNGRLARILANLMALQAGLPLLDYENIKGKKRLEYFAAVRAGIDTNYEPMKKVFNEVIRRTLRRYKAGT